MICGEPENAQAEYAAMGGNEPAYRFGAELLRWLAPPHDGPEETVAVPEPDGSAPTIDGGIKWRSALLSQARAVRVAIERHDPDRIVTLGGDCLVDLVPIAYLSRKYRDKLGVLWVDAHPDVMSAAEFSHAHAHVLGMLLGRGDEDFTAEVPEKLAARRVMIAGMTAWSKVEDPILKELGIRHAPPISPKTAGQSSTGSRPKASRTLPSISTSTCPLLFNRPDTPEDTFAGIIQGTMRLEQVVRLLKDAGSAADIAIGEGKASSAWLPIRRESPRSEASSGNFVIKELV